MNPNYAQETFISLCARLPQGASIIPPGTGPSPDKKVWICGRIHAHGRVYCSASRNTCRWCNNSRRGDEDRGSFVLEDKASRLLFSADHRWRPAVTNKDLDAYDRRVSLNRRWPEHEARAIFIAFVKQGIPEDVARAKIQERVFRLNVYVPNFTATPTQLAAQNPPQPLPGNAAPSNTMTPAQAPPTQPMPASGLRLMVEWARVPEIGEDYMIFSNLTENCQIAYEFTLVMRLYLPAIIKHVNNLIDTEIHKKVLAVQGWRTTALAFTQAILERENPFDHYFKKYDVPSRYIFRASRLQIAYQQLRPHRVPALLHFIQTITASLIARNATISNRAMIRGDNATVERLRYVPGQEVVYGTTDLQDRLWLGYAAMHPFDFTHFEPPFMPYAEFLPNWELHVAEDGTARVPELDRQWDEWRTE